MVELVKSETKHGWEENGASFFDALGKIILKRPGGTDLVVFNSAALCQIFDSIFSEWMLFTWSHNLKADC